LLQALSTHILQFSFSGNPFHTRAALSPILPHSQARFVSRWNNTFKNDQARPFERNFASGICWY
jgi:hypothetical protein